MPNRILKEGLLTSRDIAELTEAEEAFWLRLLLVCDDYGRFFADPEIVRARCFPRGRAEVTEAEVARRLDRLEALGLIARYVVDGEPYLRIPSWDRHQQKRARASKYPAPDDQPQPAPAVDTSRPAADGPSAEPESNGGQLQAIDIRREQVPADAQHVQADVPVVREARNERRETRGEKRSSAPAKPAPKREPDPLWDVLVELYGEPRSRSGRGAVVRDLRAFGATPDAVRDRVLGLSLSEDTKWAVVTAHALAEHWGNRVLAAQQRASPGTRSAIVAARLEAEGR